MKNQDASLWNKKAESYNRFSKDPQTFQAFILSKIAQRGISFDGKRVLDIGCGTGVYTLHIAKNSAHVTALDFSQEMLSILEEDALKEGLHTRCTFAWSTWSDFKNLEPFDIVFSSMSPAFQSDADFQKMSDYAREYCVYLGWGGKRESTLLDPIFQAHEKTLNVPAGSDKVRQWLEQVKIPYIAEYIEEKRSHAKPFDKALESVLWHFEINELTPDTQRVTNILKKMQNKEGVIPFETTIGVELISWKK